MTVPSLASPLPRLDEGGVHGTTVSKSGASSMTVLTIVVPTLPPFCTTAWITSRKVSMPTRSPCSMTTSEPMSCFDITSSADDRRSSGRTV